MKSLPARERGLKPFVGQEIARTDGVAPRAGAWIETDQSKAVKLVAESLPRAGAWIQTNFARITRRS